MVSPHLPVSDEKRTNVGCSCNTARFTSPYLPFTHTHYSIYKMDSLFKAGQSFLQNQSGGGQQQQQQGGSVGGFDLGSIISSAQHHDQQGSGGSDMFSQAASFLQNKHGDNPDGDIDENELMQSHQKVNEGGQAHSNEIGQAAA